MTTAPPLLEIRDLHVSAEDGAILRGVDLTVGAGEIHALMGPNGAGKSTLAGALMGHPAYTVTAGSILLNGEDVTHWATDVRAKAGLFLAFQYPESIEGVSVTQFLRQAMAARKGTEEVSVLEVRVLMTEWMERLGMDTSFASRHLNQGFSGGEKKRNEILQMALLEPLVAVLDETDSGLDIDALRVVGRGVRAVREARPELGVLAITHYTRLLEELVPDVVHILVDGRVVASGGPELAVPGRDRGLRGLAMTAEYRRAPGTPAPLNVEALRKDFPLLTRTVNGRPVVYLDSASSALQPQAVIDAMSQYYETTHANVHRGVYATAEEATALYERARLVAGRFIGAPDPAHEVVFTKNTTESLNLVAQSWGRANLRAGDAVLLTEMEHHANIVPWMILSEELGGLDLRYIPIDGDGRLVLDDLDRLVDGVKVVGVSTMSNVLGTINPVRHDRRGGPRGRRAGGGRRRAARPPLAGRRARARRRLHRLLGPQDDGPDRHRRPVGPGRAARRHAALPRRRRHDPRRQARQLQGGAAAGPLRGRHAAHRRGGGPHGGHRLPERHRDGPHPGPRAGPDQVSRWPAWTRSWAPT